MTRARKTAKLQVGKYTPDSFALVPASLLPFREQWRQIVGELPAGDVLMIVPTRPGKLCQVLRTLSPALRACGRRVTTLSAESLT